MNSMNEVVATAGDPLYTGECEKLVKSTTFINDEKAFECSSGMNPVSSTKSGFKSVEIFMSSNKLSDHIKGVMGHVNEYFTKKVKEEKAK
ncbi:conserved Plasmodium protein, unknown function [Plasmodium ovale wallikeri]|uniref:Uncharacterized protein n=2 Tax=Plasmodium ovale TaxID=36330 RepID=A0A1A8YZ21_PLAOA|nr:conserved Plasmodium protein, unknown function [Plasmodium ovale wallikeri]SBT37499.1 conserved Plasmodium protein, unknown function [Plasmodium ovale wallikeri]SBT77497.1 conserved Plasmodium protein, unknown function [Plasmodium ovale]